MCRDDVAISIITGCVSNKKIRLLFMYYFFSFREIRLIPFSFYPIDYFLIFCWSRLLANLTHTGA